MTQTFRSRDEQVMAFGHELIDLRGSKDCTELSLAERHILEAEARGAAEERGKGAEGCEIVRQYLTSRNQWEDCSQDRIWEMAIESDATRRILYTRPANVAALETRIAELEGALGSVRGAIENADPDVLICTLWMPGEAETVCDFISAALKREGGV